MTIPIEQTSDVVGRRRACEVLGIESHAAPDERRRACLAQLDGADYDPPAAWHDSVDALIRAGLTPSAFGPHSMPALYEVAETGLSEEIEEFAARFFAVEPVERSRIWTDLSSQAEFSPNLKRRLALLESGLPIDVPQQLTSDPERQRRLLHWILSYYTSTLPARTAIWVVVCDEIRDSPEAWELAAERLASKHPEIARLAPELVDSACSWRSQRRVVQQRTKTRRRNARRKTWARWRSAVTPGGGSSWMIMVAVIMGIRFIGSSLSHVDFGANEPASRRPTIGIRNFSENDVLDAREFFNRTRIERETRLSGGRTAADADPRFETGTAVDPESLKEGFRAYRLIEEIKRRRALRRPSESGIAGGSSSQTTEPPVTEPGPAATAEPQDDERSDESGLP